MVVLEGVEKPGNLGAVLRSADGAGADAVVAASPRTDLFNPNAIRASAGTVFSRPDRVGADAPTCWPGCAAGDPGRGARVDAERLYTDADLTGPLALVLGAEADGLTDAWAAPDIEADPAADARRRRQPQRLGQRPRSWPTRRDGSAADRAASLAR